MGIGLGVFQGIALAYVALDLMGPVRAIQGTRGDTTPESVVIASFRAVQDGDWAELIALTAPRALARARRDIVRLINGLDSRRTGLRDRQSVNRMLSEVFGVESMDDLEKLLPESTVVRYLAYTRYGYIQSTKQHEHDWQPEILGHVLDGDSLAYVIVRKPLLPSTEAADAPVDDADEVRESDELIDFVTLTRAPGGQWRTMLNGGLLFNRNGFGFESP